jgi:hypothetical protein
LEVSDFDDAEQLNPEEPENLDDQTPLISLHAITSIKKTE